MTIQQEYAELQEIRSLIENPSFQKYIVKEMRDYQEKQKNAYQCESLKELWNIKGKKDGSEEFFRILKKIDIDYKNKKLDIENTGE